MKKPLRKKVVKASNLPVTKKMLYRVRDSLRSDTTALRHELRGVKSDIKAGFLRMEARFAKIEARFAQSDARFAKMESTLHQMHLLLEEQNAKNNFVMDGLNFLYYRQERLEKGNDI